MGKYLVADTLIRIKNAQARKHKNVIVQASKIVKNLLDILKEEGRIFDYNLFDLDTEKEINEIKDAKRAGISVKLRYYIDKRHVIEAIPVIRKVKLYSKPSCRVYKGRDELKKMIRKFDLNLYIVSTSKGLAKVVNDNVAASSGNEAYRLGGELICRIA